MNMDSSTVLNQSHTCSSSLSPYFLGNRLETIFNLVVVISRLAYNYTMYKNRTISLKENRKEILSFKFPSTNYSNWWLTFAKSACVLSLVIDLPIVSSPVIISHNRQKTSRNSAKFSRQSLTRCSWVSWWGTQRDVNFFTLSHLWIIRSIVPWEREVSAIISS